MKIAMDGSTKGWWWWILRNKSSGKSIRYVCLPMLCLMMPGKWRKKEHLVVWCLDWWHGVVGSSSKRKKWYGHKFRWHPLLSCHWRQNGCFLQAQNQCLFSSSESLLGSREAEENWNHFFPSGRDAICFQILNICKGLFSVWLWSTCLGWALSSVTNLVGSDQNSLFFLLFQTLWIWLYKSQ